MNFGQQDGTIATNIQVQEEDMNSVYELVHDINIPEKREEALTELSKRRENMPDLAPVLWYSFGTITSLLQEIVAIYPFISPPQLSAAASNRVCNSLALLQCVASHPETKRPFLHAHIPLFLYPFLNTVTKTKAFEYLRLTSLGVIGALVKTDDSHVINFLLTTEIIPLCLRIMENGSELSKTVATFIIQKILNDDKGLSYVCFTTERLQTVMSVLSKMISGMAKQLSAMSAVPIQMQQPPNPNPGFVRLLKHIIRCFYRLRENPSAYSVLWGYLPQSLKDGTFDSIIKDDPNSRRWLLQLLSHLDPSDSSRHNYENVHLSLHDQQDSVGAF